MVFDDSIEDLASEPQSCLQNRANGLRHPQRSGLLQSSTLASRAPKSAQGAFKTPLIRLQDRPRTSQDASRTAPSAPKTPPRLSKSLQDGSGSLQDASKSSPEEVFETPSHLQKLSGGAFQASSLLETLCCKQEVFGNGSGSAGTAQRIQFP